MLDGTGIFWGGVQPFFGNVKNKKEHAPLTFQYHPQNAAEIEFEWHTKKCLVSF